jgi:hypothetical protein
MLDDAEGERTVVADIIFNHMSLAFSTAANLVLIHHVDSADGDQDNKHQHTMGGETNIDT